MVGLVVLAGGQSRRMGQDKARMAGGIRRILDEAKAAGLSPRIVLADRSAFGGPDDCFSSDFTDAELGEKLGHLGTGGGCRTLFVHSLADEYVPPHVDVPALAARFVAAAGGPSTAEALLVPEASHSLATPPDVAAEHLFPAVDRLLRAVK